MRAVHRLVLLLIATALASCANRGAIATDKVVGRWRSSQGSQAAEYRFGSDGAFTGRVTSGRAVISDFTGQWSLREGSIVYRYTADRLDRIPAGTIDRDKLLSVAKDHYVIEAADGSRRTYVRVPE